MARSSAQRGPGSQSSRARAPKASPRNVLEEAAALEAKGWPRAPLEQLLRALPPEDEYHPDASARLIGRHFPKSQLAFRSILADPGVDPEIGHRALVAVATTLHNQLEYSKLRALLAENRGRFSAFLRWRMFATLPPLLITRDDFAGAIVEAERFASATPQDPGVLAHLADLLLTASERYPDAAEGPARATQALALINQALQIEAYPKYFYLRGRAHLILGDRAQAKANALEAIDREDMARGDYVLRLQTYNQLSMMIDLSSSIEQLTVQFQNNLADAIRRQEENARAKQIEFVGFFVAVMSFVITGFGLAQRYPVVAAAQLLFVTGACLVAAIAGFSLLSRSDRWGPRLISIGASLALSAVLLATSAFVIPKLFAPTDRAMIEAAREVSPASTKASDPR